MKRKERQMQKSEINKDRIKGECNKGKKKIKEKKQKLKREDENDGGKSLQRKSSSWRPMIKSRCHQFKEKRKKYRQQKSKLRP